MDEPFSTGFADAFQKLSLAATPLAKGRRASLASCERRISAVSQPESHPVSPAGSDGGGSRSGGADGSSGAGSPADRGDSGGSSLCGQRSPVSPPATSHFSIPAMRGASLTPPCTLQPPLAPVPEERVTLNLFVLDAATPHSSSSARKHAAAEEEDASLLRKEVDALRVRLAEQEQAAAAAAEAAEAAQGQHDEQLQEAAAAATAAPAAAAAAESSSSVALVVNVVDAAALPQQAAPTVSQPTGAVQLVLNILEPVTDAATAAEQQAVCTTADAAAAASAGAAFDPAAVQQQLARAEACREELARQAGQLKGRIAKLEGALLAGESRVKAQAAELEGLKSRSRELEAALAAAQAQVGVTPDRTRTERRRLAEQAAEAQAAAEAHAGRAQRLAAVLAFEERERRELSDFAAVEHQLLTEAERGVAAEAVQWRADAGAAAAQLAEARQRLVDTDAALMQRDEEVRQLRGELEAAQAATESAAQLAGEWRQRAEQYDRDRQVAAANIRKAERELELVAQDNERMFRQLNFVRTRLMGQLAGLDTSVPDIGKLARELQSWCDREAAQRLRPKP